MVFAKGQSGNPKGRVKGSKNEKNLQWEKFRDFMMNAGLERFELEMKSLKGKDYVASMKDMMEFFQPKLARTELTGKNGERLIPKPIIDVSANNSDKKD
tara:strand:+ start:3111 stop:3407 length:297 start_codon:yes stop_codon:yes gene_type:complete